MKPETDLDQRRMRDGICLCCHCGGLVEGGNAEGKTRDKRVLNIYTAGAVFSYQQWI